MLTVLFRDLREVGVASSSGTALQPGRATGWPPQRGRKVEIQVLELLPEQPAALAVAPEAAETPLLVAPSDAEPLEAQQADPAAAPKPVLRVVEEIAKQGNRVGVGEDRELPQVGRRDHDHLELIEVALEDPSLVRGGNFYGSLTFGMTVGCPRSPHTGFGQAFDRSESHLPRRRRLSTLRFSSHGARATSRILCGSLPAAASPVTGRPRRRR